jgi:predicted DCC family thiol-disulfide oxidoreductase YuxK
MGRRGVVACAGNSTWVVHFIPRVIRDAIYDLVARNRYRWFGRRDACILP